ncbi:MAG: hypothetical protein ACRDS9_16145, partial [Pseudonocardiaceae bacterium]
MTEQQTVSNAAQAVQALDSFGHQGDLGVAANFADTGPAVRIDVEEGVTGVAAGEHFALPEMLHRLR